MGARQSKDVEDAVTKLTTKDIEGLRAFYDRFRPNFRLVRGPNGTITMEMDVGGHPVKAPANIIARLQRMVGRENDEEDDDEIEENQVMPVTDSGIPNEGVESRMKSTSGARRKAWPDAPQTAGQTRPEDTGHAVTFQTREIPVAF